MSFHKRLDRLEKIAVQRNPQIRIAHFVIRPKHNPTEYEYQGRIFTRNEGETVSCFQQRCCDSINWPSDKSERVIFRIPE